MGNKGIDKWCYLMEEHRRKGHHLIRAIEQEPLIKEHRVTFWEKYHSIANDNDIMWGEV